MTDDTPKTQPEPTINPTPADGFIIQPIPLPIPGVRDLPVYGVRPTNKPSAED